MIFRKAWLLKIGWALALVLTAPQTHWAASGSSNGAADQTATAATSAVHLYFADDSNAFLTAEQRKIFPGPDPTAFAAAIVKALIEGPQKNLVRTIPVGTKLRAVYVLADGRCFVDLSATVRQKHPGGCHSELLTIYSVVNSLVLNIAQIKTVKLLINGAEAPTLAGHIDLRLPVAANMLLIR